MFQKTKGHIGEGGFPGKSEADAPSRAPSSEQVVWGPEDICAVQWKVGGKGKRRPTWPDGSHSPMPKKRFGLYLRSASLIQSRSVIEKHLMVENRLGWAERQGRSTGDNPDLHGSLHQPACSWAQVAIQGALRAENAKPFLILHRHLIPSH